MWNDFIQEEIRRGSLHASRPTEKGGGENVDLAGKAMKISSGGATSKWKNKKKDMRKFKCFTCHQPGHYAS